jgi:hypothetical protein
MCSRRQTCDVVSATFAPDLAGLGPLPQGALGDTQVFAGGLGVNVDAAVGGGGANV